jgi:antitoxin component YwqK of YwqJK toxin-antitoxin module
MKKFMLLGAMLISGVIFSQSVQPKHEVEGDLVKSTYYYDNGKVSQEGYYKDGKVHGKWISYDQDGNKTAIAEYNNGEKTGKWFFWSSKNLSEVDYSDSRVAAVKTWKEEAIVNRN